MLKVPCVPSEGGSHEIQAVVIRDQTIEAGQKDSSTYVGVQDVIDSSRAIKANESEDVHAVSLLRCQLRTFNQLGGLSDFVR